MTADERAEKLLRYLVGEETCLGVILPPGTDPREHDPNHWRGRQTKGESFKIIRDAIRAAILVEREMCIMICEEYIAHQPEPTEHALGRNAAAAAIAQRIRLRV
jgi:hypothetical protein